MPNTSSQHDQLRSAIHQSLDDYGIGLLEQPRRLMSFVLDYADSDDRATKVLCQQLDDELLESTLKAAHAPQKTSLENARDRTMHLLVDVRSIEPGMAMQAADGLVGGVADYLELPLEPLPQAVPDQPVSGPARSTYSSDRHEANGSPTSGSASDVARDNSAPGNMHANSWSSSSYTAPGMHPVAAPPQYAPPPGNSTPTWLVTLIAFLACALVGLVVIILSGEQTTSGTSITDSAITAESANAEDAETVSENESEQEAQNTTKEEKANPPVFSTAIATSELEPDGYSDSYGAENVLSDDRTHAWNAETPDGEWIQLTADSEQSVKGFGIVAGYIKSQEVYYKNCRPQQISVELSDGYKMTTTLEDAFGKEQKVNFDKAHKTTYLKVYIDSVYYGNKYDDLCISRIRAF